MTTIGAFVLGWFAVCLCIVGLAAATVPPHGVSWPTWQNTERLSIAMGFTFLGIIAAAMAGMMA